MDTITFNCHFITPAFLGGADPKGTPELRPPSIKGALRFWWRTMNGHLVLAEENGKPVFQNLLKNDELLFGGINQTLQKSPIFIKTVEKEMRYIRGGDVFHGGRFEGMEYLFYSLKHHKKDDMGFDSGSEFDIVFMAQENNRETLIKAISSFWLLVNLGSLGTRGRRCAGSFCVDSIDDKKGIIEDKLTFLPKIDESTINFLKSNFKKIQQFNNSKEPVVFKKYSLLDQETPAYLSNLQFDTWQETVDNIGKEMIAIRKGRTSPIKEKRTFTMETLNKKAAFGIPVGVFSDNPVTFEHNERRASPLFLSVVFNNIIQKYHWIVTHFNGDFMPEDDRIIFKSKKVRNKDLKWQREDNSLVIAFMDKIKNKAQKI